MQRLRHALAVLATAMLWPRFAHAAAGEPQGMGMLVLKSAGSLAAVLALFALVIWAMRRLQGKLAQQGTRNLSLESRISLDTRNSLAIVRHGEQRWLLGISPSGITRIDSLEEASPAAAKEPA